MQICDISNKLTQEIKELNITESNYKQNSTGFSGLGGKLGIAIKFTYSWNIAGILIIK